MVSRDTFIYEYKGEVVSHPSFAKRMREYAEEGIRHFYFMMLQKDEVRDSIYYAKGRLYSLSLSTQRRREALDASRTTVAIQTAT